MTKLSHPTILLTLVLCPAMAQDAPPLFRDAGEKRAPQAAGSNDSPAQMWVLRTRAVALNRALLTEPGARISFNLFPDAIHDVDHLRTELSTDGRTTLWFGRIAAMRRSQVVLAFTDDIVTGSIQTETGAFYQIRGVEGGTQEIRQVEYRPGELTDDTVRVTLKPEEPRAAAAIEPAAASTTIDIMVVYTQAARSAAGGTAAIQNRIELAVAEANQAYANSGVDLQLRLVRTGEVNFNESVGLSVALDRLQGTSDGYMDEVHTWRNESGADIVSLWIQNVGSAGGVVGLGYLLTSPSSSFAPYAFSVVEQYWAPGPAYSFAHEVGHNQGCAHDRAHADGQGAYSYSYGYQKASNPSAFRTIMAYACSNVYCPVIGQWSNPDVLYAGNPTGVSSTAPNSADNRLTLNNTKAIAAAWRATASSCSYSLNPGSANIGSSATTGSVGVSTNSICAWTAVSNDSWIVITSGASGTGNGTAGYSVSANSGASQRVGSIVIGGQTFTITQAAAAASTVAITVATSPAGLSLLVDGVTYSAPRTFNWTAGSGHSIGVASPQNSSAAGVRYVFAAWSDGGSQTHTIQTPASAAAYSATFSTFYQLSAVALPSGSGTVSASPPSGDGYYTSGATVSITAAPAAGYSFAGWSGDAAGSANPLSVAMSGPRGVIGNFAAAVTCTYSLSAPGASHGSGAETGSVNMIVAANCPWAVVSNANWIVVTSGASGSGNGNIQYALAANATGAARTGTLTIGGVTFTVTQNAASCAYTLSTPSAVAGSGAGVYSVGVGAGNGCAWNASANPSWIAFVGAAAGSGDGGVQFSLGANPGSLPRTGSIALGGSMFPLIQSSPAPVQLFQDVPVAYTFFNYIWLLRQNGVTSGCSASLFCPEANTTRGQMAVFIIRSVLGSDVFSYPGTPYFDDVPTSHPYFKYVQKMRELGITSGCSATSYCPEGAVTRGQMAAFLMRAKLGATFPYAATPYFSDVPVSHPYFSYIQRMRELGVTTGCSATQYCPDSANTRAQMAAFLIRAFFTP